MVASFRSEIPGYRRLPTPVLERQIVEIAQRNVELCFDTISEGSSPSPEQLEPFRASARDRASEGMPLEDLLHAYRLGGRLGWRAIAASAGEDEQRTLVEAAELVMRYVDEVSAAVAQSYLDERQQLVSEEERTVRDLFETIVRDQPLDGRLARLAERHGFELGEAYHPFVIRVPVSGGRRHADLAGQLRHERVLALTEGDRVAGLLTPAARERARLPAGLTVIGEATPRAMLTQALDEVRAVAELAERRGLTGTVSVAEFSLELLLRAAPRHAQANEQRVLAPLSDAANPRGSDLLGTLTAFVDHDLDRRATAAALHVHPNTLDYRLRRVRDLTGLDLRRPEAIAQLVLALTQRKLAAS
jgi:hypothetical protein